jgi:hypothetical protein
MKTRTILLFLNLSFATVCFAASVWEKLSYKPKEGFVPDERTAAAITVAVWTPIYGEKQIASGKPYAAILKEGIWTVEGSSPKGWVGGVAIAEIAQSDGRIIAVVARKMKKANLEGRPAATANV